MDQPALLKTFRVTKITSGLWEDIVFVKSGEQIQLDANLERTKNLLESGAIEEVEA